MTASSVVIHAFADEARPAQALADALGIELALIDLHTFPDGELLPTIAAPADTTIVYRSLARPNDKLMALCLACDAWRQGGVRRLVLAAPYLCYLRQDAVFAPGQPNSQRVIGELLGSRFDRILTVDAHLHRTPALSAIFPRIETTDLSAAPVIAEWLRQTHPDIECIVGPDVESEKWVGPAATRLGIGSLLMTKERHGDRDVRLVLNKPDTIAGRAVALIDDVCSSGGTLIAATKLLKGAGAREIVVCVTHALFDNAAEQGLLKAGASKIVSTDAITHSTNAIALAPLLAEALQIERGD
jgi:ribose-phosphate pyrophosphokinase